MRGDGLSFPVNPDTGGESAPGEWAGVVSGQDVVAEASGGLMNGYNGEERYRHRRDVEESV